MCSTTPDIIGNFEIINDCIGFIDIFSYFICGFQLFFLTKIHLIDL